MRRTLPPLIATGATLLAAVVITGPAHAAPRSTLTASVQPAHGPVTTASLTCQPPGGSHPKAAAACATLAKAGGDPRRITPLDRMCTMEYAPVTASLTGRWKGRAIRYRAEFSNACTMHLATRTVFQI